MSQALPKNEPLKRTPLYTLHCELGANMVPFAGYDMPLHYGKGIVEEHHHTREQVSLFDVSHMGQVEISGPRVQNELEWLLPLDLDKLSLSHMAYTVITNAQGGILDDLLITRRNRDNFYLVVNASRKEIVIAHLMQHLEHSPIHVFNDHALLALQGPKAHEVLLKIFPSEVATLGFMEGMLVKHQQHECFISRSGYTGEDGYEISVPETHAESLARTLLSVSGVEMAGLGARDSLRLEAGLCLYGHELDETTSLVEAGLQWSVPASRREGGNKQGAFVGADVVLRQLKLGTERQRVGLQTASEQPVAEGAKIVDGDGAEVGAVTSSAYSPSLGKSIAMAYINTAAMKSPSLYVECAELPGNGVAVEVCDMPFVPHRYVRGSLL